MSIVRNNITTNSIIPIISIFIIIIIILIIITIDIIGRVSWIMCSHDSWKAIWQLLALRSKGSRPRSFNISYFTKQCQVVAFIKKHAALEVNPEQIMANHHHDIVIHMFSKKTVSPLPRTLASVSAQSTARRRHPLITKYHMATLHLSYPIWKMRPKKEPEKTYSNLSIFFCWLKELFCFLFCT